MSEEASDQNTTLPKDQAKNHGEDRKDPSTGEISEKDLEAVSGGRRTKPPSRADIEIE